LNPIVSSVIKQLDEPGNTQIVLPEQFNFGFDIIDYAADHNDKNAYLAVSGDGESVEKHRFSDLKKRSNQLANMLRNLGVRRGDFAIIILPRIPAWYEVIVGTIKLGVVSMPGTNLLTARDIEYRINQAAANTVIVTPEHVGKIEEIRANCPSLKHFVVVGASRDGWVRYADSVDSSSTELSSADVGTSQGDDLMMLYFTSGTTANPKLVPRTHHYSLAHAITGAYWLDLKRDDIHWTLSDTGWAKAAWGMLFGPWLMDATMVLFDGSGFDADLHLRLIRKLNVSTFCSPPTIFRLFAQMDLGVYDLSSIRHTVGAGEPLNPEVIRVWKEATGTLIYDGYGQTETVNIVANVPSLEVKPGSMGKAAPGFDVQIIDDDGNIVADDVIGHIALRVTDPPPPGLFDGYFEGPDSRLRTEFRHGWYYTGDTATRDGDGYIWFVGRADDVISSSGYRISPFEVESVLLEHPDIVESAVVGKPDELRGHIVKAFVVLAEGLSGSPERVEEIQNFVKQTTAPYKYPREIEFRDALPKTISGKIRRVELREKA